MAMYSDRNAIPKSHTHSVAQGKLSPQPIRPPVSRDATIREVEVDAIMSVEMALLLQRWLGQMIEYIDQINQMSGDQQ